MNRTRRFTRRDVLRTAAGAGAAAAAGLRPQLLDLLKITRLDRLLKIKPTRKEAIVQAG
jgi:hypothetical protein